MAGEIAWLRRARMAACQRQRSTCPCHLRGFEGIVDDTPNPVRNLANHVHLVRKPAAPQRMAAIAH